jgi:hypothetical protein
LRHLGGYNEHQRYNYEDWELAIRMLEAGLPIITLPLPMMRYRVRRDSIYRGMNEVQDQVMKEQMFKTHRELVACFAVEIAAQLENRWMSLRYPEERFGAQIDFQNLYSQRKMNPTEVASRFLKPLQALLNIKASLL